MKIASVMLAVALSFPAFAQGNSPVADLVRQAAAPASRPGAIQELFQLSGRNDPHTLLEIAREIKLVAPGLARKVQTISGVDGEALVGTLAQPRSEAETLVPILTGGLTNRDWLVRRATAFALAQHEGSARAALPTLEKALADERSLDVLWAMAQTLGRIDSNSIPRAVDMLMGVVTNKTDAAKYAREHAAVAVVGFPAHAKRAVPAVTEMLSHPEPQMRDSALSILTEAGAEAAPALPVLLQMLGRDDPGKLGVVEIIGRIGRAAKEALPALKKMAAASQGPERFMIFSAIARVDPTDAAAVGELFKALNDGEPPGRAIALLGLAALAPQDKRASEAVGQALREWPENDRIELAIGLSSLRPQPFDAETRAVLQRGLTNSSRLIRVNAQYALRRLP